jgi:hypothetical protein
MGFVGRVYQTITRVPAAYQPQPAQALPAAAADCE